LSIFNCFGEQKLADPNRNFLSGPMASCFVGGLDDLLAGKGETRFREKSVNDFLVSGDYQSRRKI